MGTEEKETELHHQRSRYFRFLHHVVAQSSDVSTQPTVSISCVNKFKRMPSFHILYTHHKYSDV